MDDMWASCEEATPCDYVGRLTPFLCMLLSLFVCFLSSDSWWLFWLKMRLAFDVNTTNKSNLFTQFFFSFRSIIMDWKQTILRQLHEKNRVERDVYAEIVKHCACSLPREAELSESKVRSHLDNRLIENYSVTLVRCTEQETRYIDFTPRKHRLAKE